MQSSRTLLSPLLPGFVTIDTMPALSVTERIALDRPAELVIESRTTRIACPLCRCDDVQVASTALAMLCTCRQCATAFFMVLSAPHGVC